MSEHMKTIYTRENMIRPTEQIIYLMATALKKAGSRYQLAVDLGLSTRMVAKWYEGVEPKMRNIELIEDYVWGKRTV